MKIANMFIGVLVIGQCHITYWYSAWKKKAGKRTIAVQLICNSQIVSLVRSSGVLHVDVIKAKIAVIKGADQIYNSSKIL